MISGSGAKMQSTSYLPAYYHIIDQNVGGSGKLWQVVSSGTTCKLDTIYNIFPKSSDSDPCLAYNKEILKQTMLKHEAIFRNQVHELHRLYGRQRELMNEISRNHRQIRTSPPNLIPSQIHYSIFQKTLDIQRPKDGKPPAQQEENSRLHSAFVSQKCTQAVSRIYSKENALGEQRISTSKSHYSGKRLLDLELPAEEYIDSEDEVGLEDRNSILVPQIQHDRSQNTSPSPTKNKIKLNEASSSNGSSNCSKTTFLFDLNEPIQLDESESPNSANFIDSSTEIMPQDHHSFEKSKSESPAQNEVSTNTVLEEKGIDGCSKFLHLKMDRPLKLVPCSFEAGNKGSILISGLQDSSAGCSPLLCGDRTSSGLEVANKEKETLDSNNQSMVCSCITSPVLISNEAKTEASTSVSSQQTSVSNFREVSFAVQALPCFNNPDLLSKTSRSSTPNSGIKRKYCNSKGNPERSPSLGSVSCGITGNSDNEHTAEHSSLVECIKNSNHTKSSENIVINVMPQSCSPNTVVSLEKLRGTDEASISKISRRQFNKSRVKQDLDGTTLEAPVSRDKNEHPPRKSEENEMPSHMSKQQIGDSNEDYDRIAAETIVSISLLDIQQCLENDKIGPLEVSSDCLSWFASIVSSVTSDHEIEFERLLNNASSSDHNILGRDEIGLIETKLLKLTGMDLEDCCPEASNKKCKTISGMMMPSHQEEKGRARKSRQKKGSLACIASLPSSNVTENLQPTEQLITAAGSTFGRNGRGRRSRNLKMVTSNEIEKKVCSLSKQHTSEKELSFTLRSLLGWGRKNTRQKSRQARANY